VHDLERRDADPADPEDPYRYGSITATSEAIAEPTHEVVRTTTPETAPHPHVRTGIEWSPGGPAPVANVLRLDLANVGAATIDVPGAQLDAAGLEVALHTDGPGVVRLLGDFGALPAVDGPAVVTLEDTGIRIEVLDAGDVQLLFPI
jgi:hypothetical protein